MGPDASKRVILMDQVPSQKKFDWLTAGQFSFSLLIGLFLIGSSLVSYLLMALRGTIGGIPVADSQLGSSLLFSAGLGFAGTLMIPSIYYSGLRLFSKTSREKRAWTGSGWLGFAIPGLIFFGYLSQSNPSWGIFVLPLFHILTNGAAIFWLLYVVKRKLPEESAQRFWGVFGSGLTFAPLIALFVEFLILIFFGILLWVFIQSQPELKQDFLILLDHFQQSSITPGIFERTTSRLFETPGIAGGVFIYIAVLIPVVEELIKPVAIWLLPGRNLSPRDGFLLGAVSGAGYALFENLTIAAETEIWTFVMISRLGTAAIHMLTTALVGWGIASARTEKRYWRLVMAFVAAITLHGVWNGLNILTALVEFPAIQTTVGTFALNFAGYAPVGVLILAIGALFGLIRANSRFQRAIMTQVILDK
jgi:hypothetical protein